MKSLIEKSKRAAGIEPASSALEGSTISRSVSLQRSEFKNKKATCEMFGEMFCSESSLKAKNSKSRIG
ncbi:hypothetical protein KBY64_11700 [Synechococcus lacustris L1E-Slac]|uniref:hypothetical protein n=1 Tax=Synechococcus lacustris TaxID=2116544 RepID=UPI0020CC4CB3|nr:hypothetical protein [Synechococcus lacustris]MCP9793928.1 hypothetical protein [Synechococcus lacustris L1F-Slac]MCP9814946.1 hypothetical protein [Synechococcus lacustris L1E-Slac]